MEVLKNMKESELGQLRAEFDAAEEPGALNIDEFKEILGKWSRRKHVPLTEVQLEVLFSDIDVNGDATVEWEEFTMFLITGETSNRGENPIKEYHVSSVNNNEVPGSVADCRFIPKINKVMKVIKRDNYGKVKWCHAVDGLPVIGETPRMPDGVLGAEYIPPPDRGTFFGKNSAKEYSLGHVLAVSCPDSTVRFYELNRRDPLQKDNFFEKRYIQFSESQNILRWSHHHNRLFCGSRSGIISTCSPDANQTSGKEKLHGEGVSDIVLSRDTMYSSSVDGSIKCTDLAKGVVRYGLKHETGILHLAVNNEHLQLFSTGFEQHATVYSLQLPKLQHRLEDKHRPHHGRIVGLEVIPRTPQVLTADSTGLVKVWDIRMYQCVQSIMTAKDRDVSATKSILSSIAAIPHANQVIVNGRDCKIFEYDASSNPHLSDDHQVSQIHYNDQVHSFLTVHQDTIKIWDGDTGVMKGAYEGVVPSDITAVCIVPPRCRKMFVGTLSGDVFGVGYAVCSVFRELPKLGNPELPESHVVCLEYLETIKDSHNPYLMVAFATEIVLFPDTDEHVKRATLPLHCVSETLGSSHITNVVALTSGSILVCTNGGVMHLVDLTTFSVTQSWTEGLIGDLQCIAHQAMDFSVFSSIAIVADGGGQLTCTLQRTGQTCDLVSCWSNITPSADLEAEEDRKRQEKKDYKLNNFGQSPGLSPASPGFSESPIAPKTSRLSAAASIRRGSTMPSKQEEKDLERKVLSILGPRPNSAVAGYFTQKRSVVYSASIECITIIESLQLLVTGDEKGQVTLWDISQVILKADFMLRGKQHPLVHSDPEIEVMRTWKAHDTDIVALTVYPSKADPTKFVVATAGEDKQVILWSLDGVALGNLSQDRKEIPKNVTTPGSKHRESGLVHGMLRFTVEIETPIDAWDDATEFLAERVEVIEEMKRNAVDPPPPLSQNHSTVSSVRGRSAESTTSGGRAAALREATLREATQRRHLDTPGKSMRRERRETTTTKDDRRTPTTHHLLSDPNIPSFFQLTDMPLDMLMVAEQTTNEHDELAQSTGSANAGTGGGPPPHSGPTLQRLPTLPSIRGALTASRNMNGLIKSEFIGSVTARVPGTDVRREQMLPPRPPVAPNSARTVGKVVPVDPNSASHELLMNRIMPPQKSAINKKRKLTKATKEYLGSLDLAQKQVSNSRFFLTTEQKNFVDNGSVVLGRKTTIEGGDADDATAIVGNPSGTASSSGRSRRGSSTQPSVRTL